MAVTAENTPLVQVAKVLAPGGETSKPALQVRELALPDGNAVPNTGCDHVPPDTGGSCDVVQSVVQLAPPAQPAPELGLEVPGTQLVVVVLKTPLVHVMNDEAPGGLIV